MLNLVCSSEPYLEVYSNLYYLLAQSEELSATDKWAGFVLTKEGEDFVQQNANLFKYDLLYNPFRLESWQRLGNIYDEVKIFSPSICKVEGPLYLKGKDWGLTLLDVFIDQRVIWPCRRWTCCLMMAVSR